MKTILIIDDDEGIRSTFGMALRSKGYRVIEADSGLTGFELAQQQLPDLILSDISMPGGDGQALLHHIRNNPELSSKQVVLMTGRADLVTPRKGMEQGADDFLVKPVSLQDLFQCVDARMNRAQINWRVEDRMLAKLRSSMHSNIPHEFFTPLGGIIGLAEVLRSDISTFSPDEVQDILRDIHHSALRLHRTLKNYLLILDLESISPDAVLSVGQMSPPDITTSITNGVKAATRRHDRAADAVVEVAECHMRANPTDLELMVEELVDNACNYSRRGSPITVKFTSDAVLTVTDQGRGMSPEELKHIGAFQQMDRKKHQQQGLGLGLVLVQKLAMVSGANFSIKSELAKGTAVRVAFQIVNMSP
jgi:two-component system sensor histidine kinase/response regulator